VLLLAGQLAADPSLGRVVLAAAALTLLGTLAAVAPRVSLATLVVWLAALGFLRRFMSGVSPFTAVDPLLLVGPAAMILLLAVAIRHGALRRRDLLANGVLVLGAITVLGAFNPLQGGLLSGLTGLLFLLVPTLAFWIGRALCDDATLAALLKLAAALALAAAAYGLMQTFRGLPSWDATWAHQVISTYPALNVGVAGNIRPFSTFSSAAEYGYYLGLGLVIWLVSGVRSRRLLLTVAVIGFLGTALAYESSRQVVFTLAIALAAMGAARLRLTLPKAVVAAAVALVALPLAAGLVVPQRFTSDSRSLLIAHQLRGLTHPFDARYSTVTVHLTLVERGLRSALREPLGLGTGAVNLAGSHFGKAVQNTEADPSNAAVALGVPGLATYLVVAAAGLSRAFAAAKRRQDALGFAALGVLGVTLFQWLSGGHYSLAFLPWLVLGWLDAERTANDDHRERAP
jgi:hypothetical protein